MTEMTTVVMLNATKYPVPTAGNRVLISGYFPVQIGVHEKDISASGSSVEEHQFNLNFRPTAEGGGNCFAEFPWPYNTIWIAQTSGGTGIVSIMSW